MRNPAAVRSAGGGGTLNAVTLPAANENALAARALWYKVPMRCTRREFNALALSAVPASLLGAIDKPDSKVAGVQIGLNVPYNFGDPKMSGDEILRRCIQLGVSAVELRSQPVEAFLGVPRSAAMDKMDRVKDFRRTYEDAGVRIEIVKFDGIYALSDAELDYCFTLARTLGARAISCEISVDDTKRLGSFADKHNMMVGYHGHEKTTPEMWEKAFAYARHNGANVDLGHFVAGNNMSPLPFITRYHDPHHARPREGSQAQQRRDRALRRRGYTYPRDAARDSRQQMEYSGDDRVRVSGAAWLGSNGGDGEVHHLLPQCAELVIRSALRVRC